MTTETNLYRSENTLYFPYIRVPDNGWFTRVLLYWDRAGSIVPKTVPRDDFPPHMQELLEVGLLEDVQPGAYLHRVPRFEENFLELVHGFPRRSDSAIRFTRIHIEKLGTLTHELTSMGLAEKEDRFWYQVEVFTATQFMLYLALVLAATLTEETPASWIAGTDELASLAAFSESGGSVDPVIEVRDSLRAIILERLLPAPSLGVPGREILDFKEKHGHLLGTFRRRIETLVLDAASVSDLHLREERIKLLLKDSEQEAFELARRMQERRWPGILFGTVCSLTTAALTGVEAAFTGSPAWGAVAIPAVITAAHTALAERRNRDRWLADRPLAYAAIAKEKLGSTWK